MFRSKYAGPETPTEVELIFSYGGKVYQVRRNPEYLRPARRGGGQTLQRAEAELTLPDGRLVTQGPGSEPGGEGDHRPGLSAVFPDRHDRAGRFSEAAAGGHPGAPGDLPGPFFTPAPYQVFQEKLKGEAGKLRTECDRARSSVAQYIQGIQCPKDSPLASRAEQARSGDLPAAEVQELFHELLQEDEEGRRSPGGGNREAGIGNWSRSMPFWPRRKSGKKRRSAFRRLRNPENLFVRSWLWLSRWWRKKRRKRPLREELARKAAALRGELPRYEELEEQRKVCRQAGAGSRGGCR